MPSARPAATRRRDVNRCGWVEVAGEPPCGKLSGHYIVHEGFVHYYCSEHYLKAREELGHG